MAGAVEITGDTYSAEAAVDLSSHQFRFVIIDSNGKIGLVTAITNNAIGILQNKPTSGKTAQVKVIGGSKLYVDDGSTITAGDLIMPGAESGDVGDGITASAGQARAIALEDGAIDTLMSVFLLGPVTVA